MIDGCARTLTIITAVGAGLTSGVFFAFSTFVMTALGRLPDADGMSAMNAINRAAPTPLFMLALLGTGTVCLPLSVIAARRLDEPWAVHLLIGSSLYLISIVLTIVYHVPRNNALALVDPRAPGAADAWARYISRWTAWNHVRTISSFGGSVTFILAMRAV